MKFFLIIPIIFASTILTGCATKAPYEGNGQKQRQTQDGKHAEEMQGNTREAARGATVDPSRAIPPGGGHY